jgi:hypothetical protein
MLSREAAPTSLRLTDKTICPLTVLRAQDKSLRPTGNFPDQFGPDRLGKVVAVANGHNERAETTDNAIFEVVIEIWNVAEARSALQHDWKTVDCDALV